MTDFIGDIHGHTDKLEQLLSKLGYEKKNGTYSHSESKMIFVGDFIDRGPDNPRVVDIARRMVEEGHAQAVMGNHEYNAVMFNMIGDKGYLRPHSLKNFKQHSATLLQYQNKQNEYDEMIAWFNTLPLYIDHEKYRVVHASWHQNSIDYLKNNSKKGILTEEQFRESITNPKLFEAVENICKGIEEPLPKKVHFLDKDGNPRTDIRIKWWENSKNKTYKEMCVKEIKELKTEKKFDKEIDYYKPNEKPIFFGHYWLEGKPKLRTSNACCLDFSVAKNGHLCAYRWDGESQLDYSKFFYV